MMSCFSPGYSSKSVARCIVSSCQRFQRITSVNLSANEDNPTESLQLEDNWNADKKSTAGFKNVSLVTPKTFTKFFFNEFKLKFVDEDLPSKAGVELLRNIAANYDYWMIRNNQAHLLYYRLEMMLQRLEYLKTIGLDAKQKLKQIQKKPPLLLFTFSNCSYSGNLVYLRGLLEKKDRHFIHLLYPVTNKLTANKITTQNHVKTIENELKIKQPAVIRELLNMPCFFMDPSRLRDIQHMFIHKYSLPYFYKIDKHTAPILPPICNLSKLGLSPEKHFSNSSSNAIISSLPTYSCTDILDVSYPVHNGKGKPECLSTFLLRAELEEVKDRTGGQPLKGRRGFNMPPRQY